MQFEHSSFFTLGKSAVFSKLCQKFKKTLFKIEFLAISLEICSSKDNKQIDSNNWTLFSKHTNIKELSRVIYSVVKSLEQQKVTLQELKL